MSGVVRHYFYATCLELHSDRQRICPTCFLVPCLRRLFCYSCFVPPKDKQPTMTGRSWRHFSVHWPHIIAGLIGPADPERLAQLTPPESSSRRTAAGSTDDGVGMEDDEDAHQPMPAGISTAEGSPYYEYFGQIAVEDAVQEMFCQIAELNGLFFGDNMQDTVHITGTEVTAMTHAAFNVGRCAQILLGPLHTSKLHRLMRHLQSELELRGNLWEGDTSRNESLHKVCKKMYLRSNKRGPTLDLQMMRGEQAQTEILRGLSDGDSEDGDESADEERVEEDSIVAAAGAPDVNVIPPDVRQLNSRGVSVVVGELCVLPGLSKLAELLELDEAQTVVVSKTIKFNATFEWGAPSEVQYLRATTAFNGSPWFDQIRYKGTNGEVCWGEARFVLRRVGPAIRHCVVVRRFRKVAPARPVCALSSHGCQRLGWDFENETGLWPSLEIVDIGRVLRLENIVPDWRDLVERFDIDAMPSKKHAQSDEYRHERFFVNTFYPWTSRKLDGGL